MKDVVRAGRGDDRPAYFESMTYNLVRGWAPLRGVLVQKEKYVDQPIPEMYDLASDPKEERNLAPQRSGQVQVLVNVLAFVQCRAARPARTRIRRGGRDVAVPRLCLRQRARAQGLHRGRRSEEPRPSRPRSAHGVGALSKRQGAGGDDAPQQRHRAAARYRGRVYLPRPRLLGVRPAAVGHHDAREGADKRRTRPRRPHPARHLPRREPDRSRPRHQAARRPAGERRRSAQRPRRGLRRRRPVCGRHPGVQAGAGARSRPTGSPTRISRRWCSGRRWRRRL